ncbi:MAG TPA: cytochrome bc complex cytochrome b subunit [Actinomycetota bacterium]|nr:cytochrome bc complex cytochrome b subunit [Actinomycetota bacterium]
MIEGLFRWFDERLGAASFARKSLRKVFPDHWSFMLGEIALYSFLILVATGVFLTFFYVPDSTPVIYHGPYRPLDGQAMSRAYQSVMRLSFEVRAGLVFRQIHHWAALVMVGAVSLHAARVFFTGAFRKPRELNWVLGVLLLVLTLLIGFAGYSLPDDLLSGTGLRIAYSVLLSVPLVGTWLAFLVFGGEYPSPDLLSRLFVLHVMILPALIGAVIAAHLAILWRQKHTNFPAPGLTEDDIRGERLWPRYAFKSVGFLMVLFGILGVLGGLVQVNPIWVYGPYSAHIVSQASQPDWYMGWLEGAIRLFPNWEIRAFGHEIPEPFFPTVLMPGLFFTALGLWPWIERGITKDLGEHNLLNFPRDVPWRTALGTAALTYFVVLTIAGGDDVIAANLGVSIETMTLMLRAVVLVLPVIAYAVALYVARELRRSGVHPVRRSQISTVRRTREGGFESTEVAGGGFAGPGEGGDGSSTPPAVPAAGDAPAD